MIERLLRRMEDRMARQRAEMQELREEIDYLQEMIEAQRVMLGDNLDHIRELEERLNRNDLTPPEN